MANVEGRRHNFAQQTSRKKAQITKTCYDAGLQADISSRDRLSTDYYSATLVYSCHLSHSRV